jgi:hypothetical protein
MEQRPERLEPELEGSDDAVVPAGASDAPEELGLLGLARADNPAIGRHELDRAQVVDCQAELALQPADAAAEREARDTRVADDAGWADEAVGLRGDVELAEECAAVCPRDALRGIYGDAAHRREVDDEAAVAARVAGGAVPTGSDRQREVVVSTEPDGRCDFADRCRSHDGGRTKVVNSIPEAPRLVV